MELYFSLSARAGRLPPFLLVICSVISVQIGTVIAIKLFYAVPASGAAFYNAFFSAVILGLISRHAKIRLDFTSLGLVAIYSVSIAGMFLAFFYAVERIPMAVGSTIEFVGPLALSVIFARKISHFAFVSLAVCGVLLLAPAIGSELDGLGVFYAVLSAIFWAVFILLSPKVSKRFEGESGLAIGMAVATVIIFPIACLEKSLINVTPALIFGQFLMALFFTIIPLSLEYIALRRMSARSFGVAVSMEPVASALVAFAALSQPIYPRMAVAIVAVTIAAIGITLVDSKSS